MSLIPVYPEPRDLLKGKTVVITAAAGTGIGYSAAKRAVEEGAKVLISDFHERRLGEAADRIADELKCERPATYVCDVTNEDNVQGLRDGALAALGKVDVLINNAGLMPIRPMAEVNTDEWDQMIDVNLKGTLYGIAAALPGFLEQGSGHIINLSSVAGIKVFAPGGTVYSGTKFAVSAISEGLRHEVGEKVRVTSIEPGAVESDLKFTTSGTAAETVLDFYKQAIPAASVARAIAFAVEQPDDVDVNAIVIRPTAQQF